MGLHTHQISYSHPITVYAKMQVSILYFIYQNSYMENVVLY